MARQEPIAHWRLAGQLSPDTPLGLCYGKEVPPLPLNTRCICLWPLGLCPNSKGGCGWDQRPAWL